MDVIETRNLTKYYGKALGILKYLTPFKYFDSSYILNEKSLEPVFIVISIGIIIIGIGGTFLFYPMRDLHI